jgi:hypothetical protein
MFLYIYIDNMNNPSPPGLMQPTMTSYPPGAGNPRDAAAMSQQQMNMSQNDLNNVIGGGKYNKNKKRQNKRRMMSSSSNHSMVNILDWNKAISGGAGNVVVPQFNMQYKAVGGPGTNPNDQIAGTSSVGMQRHADALYDAQARQMGGNPDWNWGCYSGGKSRRKRTRKMRRVNRKNSKKQRRITKTCRR